MVTYYLIQLVTLIVAKNDQISRYLKEWQGIVSFHYLVFLLSLNVVSKYITIKIGIR